MQLQYDLIVVGTGFASSFFLLSYLERLGPHARVLVLERGTRESPQWQRLNRRNSSLEAESLFANRTPRKRWRFTAGFGGGSNCWWAVTPRMLPNGIVSPTTGCATRANQPAAPQGARCPDGYVGLGRCVRRGPLSAAATTTWPPLWSHARPQVYVRDASRWEPTSVSRV